MCELQKKKTENNNKKNSAKSISSILRFSFLVEVLLSDNELKPCARNFAVYPHIGYIPRRAYMSQLLRRTTKAINSDSRKSVARTRLQLLLNHVASTLRSFSSVSVGSKFTKNYKNYATSDGKVVSYFHDIPIDLVVPARTATMIVEVPRWSNAKFEIDTKTPGNPIVQDVKNGQVRFVKNLFPYHGYIHNYGALPQTWENPTERSTIEGLLGDGDPLDVCEIGSEILETGLVTSVRILGSLALVDDGDLDWKIIAINSEDPLADQLSDLEDIHKVCPGLLEATRQWLRDYKRPDGKPENAFALAGQYRNLQETLQVIEECHEAWKKLVKAEIQASCFAIDNVTLKGTPNYVSSFPFEKDVMESGLEPEGPIPSEISRNYFL